jgi:ADP-ribose pyrophosphatase
MKYKLNTTESAYNGFMKIELINVTHERFDGSEMTITRELLSGGDAIFVLLHDSKQEQALFVRQFRIGLATAEGNVSAFPLELVAGLIDDGELPEQAALRELEEETAIDLQKDQLEHVYSGHQSVGSSRKQVHIYVADVDLSTVDTSKSYGEDDHEDIQLSLLSYSTLRDRLRSKSCETVHEFMALQHLAIHKNL